MADRNVIPDAAHRRRGWVWAAVAALVVVVVAVVVVAVLTSRPAPKGRNAADSSSSTPYASPTTSDAPTPGASAPATPGPAPTSPFPQLPPASPQKTVETDGFAVRLAKIEHVRGEASGAGEIAGPALRLTVQIANHTTQPLALDFVVVNAAYGVDLTPANTFERPGGKPFGGTLAPGKTASGVLLFAVPTAQQKNVMVSVDYRPGSPAVVFRGSFR